MNWEYTIFRKYKREKFNILFRIKYDNDVITAVILRARIKRKRRINFFTRLSLRFQRKSIFKQVFSATMYIITIDTLIIIFKKIVK